MFICRDPWVFSTHRIPHMMLEMAEWVQKSRHDLRFHFLEVWCLLILVSPLICLWRIQYNSSETPAGVVAGWDWSASRREKSQLPSLGLGHIWGTTCAPNSMWKQTITSLSMTCMKSDPDWFHHFFCPTSHRNTLVSLGEFVFVFNFGCTRYSFLLRTSLLAAITGYSVIATHWFSVCASL